MIIYMKSKNDKYLAKAKYDVDTKKTIVLKGSRVSEDIAHSQKFRGTRKLERLRSLYVIDNIVQEDVLFNSSSTAAVFVSGRSKNGLCTWITDKGQKLGDYIISQKP